tara:strand:+ start:582 stop:866 length:285 start_codon:yes stop_codon:yes gene_type:complete
MKWVSKLIKVLPLLGGFLLYLIKGQRDRAREQREALKKTLKSQEIKRDKEEALNTRVEEVRDEARKNEVAQAERRGRGDRGEQFGDQRLRDRQG